MTTPTTAELLKYADLQMAAEAFLLDANNKPYLTSKDVIAALKAGNGHSSKFTESQAKEFEKHWIVLDQRANTSTGFSGTLFQNKDTNELVLSFRSTEFIDDSARDNQATNSMEIKEASLADGLASYAGSFIVAQAFATESIAACACKSKARRRFDPKNRVCKTMAFAVRSAAQ
jgi:hypothetical protein